MSCKELYQTDDLDFATLLCYLYGWESLQVINFDGIKATLKLAIPSEDAKILRAEFVSDTTSVLLCSYCKMRMKLNRTLRDARRDGHWVSASWVNGTVAA
jgi:hypothetical protein